MCGFCGSFSEHRHWSAGPLTAARQGAVRIRIAHMAGELAAPAGVRLTAWRDRFQLTGPTGKRELATDLASIWRAVDRLGRAMPDPLDDAFFDGLEAQAKE